MASDTYSNCPKNSSSSFKSVQHLCTLMWRHNDIKQADGNLTVQIALHNVPEGYIINISSRNAVQKYQYTHTNDLDQEFLVKSWSNLSQLSNIWLCTFWRKFDHHIGLMLVIPWSRSRSPIEKCWSKLSQLVKSWSNLSRPRFGSSFSHKL